MFLLTDGVSRTEFKMNDEVNGIELSYDVWDIRRLHRLATSGQKREPIEIDFRGWAFLMLAAGPIVGIAAMARLRAVTTPRP